MPAKGKQAEFADVRAALAAIPERFEDGPHRRMSDRFESPDETLFKKDGWLS